MYEEVGFVKFALFCLQVDIITDLDGIIFLESLEMGDSEVTYEPFNMN